MSVRLEGKEGKWKERRVRKGVRNGGGEGEERRVAYVTSCETKACPARFFLVNMSDRKNAGYSISSSSRTCDLQSRLWFPEQRVREREREKPGKD